MTQNADFAKYEHILGSIDEVYADRVHAILQFLAFGNEPLLQAREFNRHPLTLLQLAEVTLIDVSKDAPIFDLERRLSPHEMLRICNGLVEVEEVPRNHYISDKETVTSLRFSSDTLKEYLISDAVRNGPAKRFATNRTSARELIVNTCLMYILHMKPQEEEVRKRIFQDLPLACYASLWWADFLPETDTPSALTQNLLRSLFLEPDTTVYFTWLKVLMCASQAYPNNHHSQKVLHLSGTTEDGYYCPAPPIVWASAFGLSYIVEQLLANNASINQPGVSGVSALFMAVHESHYSVAELLLENGGGVADGFAEARNNARAVISLSPLYHAAWFGKSKLLALLVSSRGDQKRFGRPGWRLEAAMELAAGGHKDSAGCIEHLVHAGADVNALGPQGGCALHDAAAAFSKEDAVRVLLSFGADPNITGGEFYTALQAAAYRDQTEIAKMLLAAGADPNIKGGAFGTPLIAASWRGYHELAAILLEAGSEITVEWNLEERINSIDGLNFKISEIKDNQIKEIERETTLDELTEEQKMYRNQELLVDETDKEPGSEWDLKTRIDLKVQEQEEFVKKHGWGCMHGTALDERYRRCGQIRRAASRISRRLCEAGVLDGPEGLLIFTAIQAAVAKEWPAVVDLLMGHGAEMPAVVTTTPDQSVKGSEKIARRIRILNSFWEEDRSVDGKTMCSSAGCVP